MARPPVDIALRGPPVHYQPPVSCLLQALPSSRFLRRLHRFWRGRRQKHLCVALHTTSSLCFELSHPSAPFALAIQTLTGTESKSNPSSSSVCRSRLRKELRIGGQTVWGKRWKS